MISGIYFLSDNDFELRSSNENEKLLSLKNETKGLYFVLVYSNTCEFCNEVISEFKQLPAHLAGLKYGMININYNKEMVTMSKETITPITYVPELILFLNGLPYMVYEANDIKLEEMKSFIKEISDKLEKTPFVVKDEKKTIDVKQDESPGSGPRPLKGKKNKKVCYVKNNNYICT